LLPERLWPLGVRRLWGVGPHLAERLARGGIRTIGELLQAGEGNLAPLVGQRAARHLCALARGEDDRSVQHDRRARSISEERTYVEDLTDAREIDRALLARAEGVARQLRREGLLARTVRLKVRTGDFHTVTRERTLAVPTDLAETLVAAARELLEQRVTLGRPGIRLLGLGVRGLARSSSRQPSLFEDPREARARRLALAADTVRRRLGEDSLTRARLLRRPRTAGGDDDAEPEEAYTPPAVD
jgi:DNA polymerase-4